ncbi:MAG: hypothetical protein EOP50_01660 [Sphingobacteriales bacterium]|nr:MAG: hypothetical protein EOP50_01660 [Sphingobacteriales bacterium]
MKYPFLLAAAGGSDILAVVEGLPVDQPGFFLTEGQMDAVEARLAEADTAVTAAATHTEALAAAQTELESTQTSLTAAQAELSTANETIATLQARVTQLEANPAAAPRATAKAEDDIPSGDQPFHASAQNPMNAMADRLLGSPKLKDPKA